MLDDKVSPFSGPYAASVVATYRSAIILQNMFSKAIELCPVEFARLHDMWGLSLVCGVSSGITALPLQNLLSLIPLPFTDYHWIGGMSDLLHRDRKCRIF